MAAHDARRDGPVETEPLAQGRPRSKIVGGRFVIERLIARGGMGAVYLAHQLNLGRPVAIKIMTPPPDGEDGQTFAERFRLEAETLAALHHPHIVTVYDYGPTEDGRYYLALEYVEGPRFTDLIRKGRMAPERAVRLMLQVCSALRYAHKRGVVHRDLKPSNLLIRVEDGVETVKVVDFGLVKVAEADQSLTRAGLVLGSPHCMAPEQVRGEEIDHRADLYAVGILLFRALTGQWPFHGETVASTMIAHVHEDRPTFHSVAPDLMVPDGLEAIVQRCIRRDPADRFGDAQELSDALARCLDIPEDQFLTVSSYPGSLAPAGVAREQEQERRHWLVPVVVAVLLLGLIAALGVWRPWEGRVDAPPSPAPGTAPAALAPTPAAPSAAPPLPAQAPPAEGGAEGSAAAAIAACVWPRSVMGASYVLSVRSPALRTLSPWRIHHTST
ncbi:serine/threonine protein kinase, partial [Myxococcota bacterium]|nr:serine/threonine protein kinase [Myxococcota bacterium]